MQVTILVIVIAVLAGLFAGSVIVLASIYFQMQDKSEAAKMSNNKKNDTHAEPEN